MVGITRTKQATTVHTSWRESVDHLKISSENWEHPAKTRLDLPEKFPQQTWYWRFAIVCKDLSHQSHPYWMQGLPGAQVNIVYTFLQLSRATLQGFSIKMAYTKAGPIDLGCWRLLEFWCLFLQGSELLRHADIDFFWSALLRLSVTFRIPSHNFSPRRHLILGPYTNYPVVVSFLASLPKLIQNTVVFKDVADSTDNPSSSTEWPDTTLLPASSAALILLIKRLGGYLISLLILNAVSGLHNKL